MLRRYVIVNGVSTAALYAAYWAFAPNASSLVQTVRHGFDLYAMDHSFLGPIFHRIVTVCGLQ